VVESRIVIPVVVGSIPISHPIESNTYVKRPALSLYSRSPVGLV
jgi:hypothetical protein